MSEIDYWLAALREAAGQRTEAAQALASARLGFCPSIPTREEILRGRDRLLRAAALAYARAMLETSGDDLAACLTLTRLEGEAIAPSCSCPHGDAHEPAKNHDSSCPAR